MSQKQYGPEAELHRDFESLTDKQRSAVEALAEHEPSESKEVIAGGENFGTSYTYYVEDHFPHLIDERRSVEKVAADGGNQVFTVELTDEKVWKAIRLLPEELSNEIFNQIKRQ